MARQQLDGPGASDLDVTTAGSPVRASLTLGVGRALGIAVDLAATTYLMRALGPGPFGLLAMATSLLTLFGALGDAGVGASLVSDKELDRARAGAATAVALGLGLLIGALVVVSTPGVVAFYDDARLGPVWLAFGLLSPLAGLHTVPRALAQRQERFGLLAWVPVGVSAAAAILAVGLAQVQQDHWPLVVRQGVQSGLGTILLWLWVRPRLALPGRADLRELFRFGRGIVAFDLLNVLNRNADKVLVGRFIGDDALGLYGLAYRVLSMPLGSLGGVVSTVAFPRLASRMPDTAAVSLELSSIMRSVGQLSTPVCLGAAAAAPELVTVLVGPRWAEAVVPFQVLALLGAYQTPFAQLGHAYTVTRRTHLLARWALVSTPITVASFALGLRWGIGGVAVAYATASLALAAPMVRFAAAALDCRSWPLARGGVRGLAEGTLLALPVVTACLVARALGASSGQVLGVTIAVGVVVEGWALLLVRRAWSAARGGESAPSRGDT